jgi:hypothetical protein
MRKEQIRQHVLRCPSRSIGVYRPPAVRFNGMSDGIGAMRRAEHRTEQAVEWLGDDRVGVIGKILRLSICRLAKQGLFAGKDGLNLVDTRLVGHV